MNLDIGFTCDNHCFRYRACAIIIENDAVLMARNDRDDYYYSIGGAVQFGETAEEACLREVYEETGVHFETERLVFIHENFFPEEAGGIFHELAFYFLMEPHEHRDFISGITSTGSKENVTWIPLKDYANYKAFPTFFAEKLSNLPTASSVS